ncbi:MAG TPA: hypothetical protein VFG63_05345 [Nocardioidaceae bacterium]|nr:hypothetical protein [Nocardioidaceae bacterium]
MRTRALAVLTAALLVLGVTAGVATAGAAAAREVTLHDARGDMWQLHFSGGTDPAPGTRVGDVRRARFTHGLRRIVVRQRYVDLRRTGAYWLYTVRLQNGSRIYREVELHAGPGSWQGGTAVFNRRGDRVACRVGHRIDYRRNLVVLAVPRRCLGNPHRVRASAASSWAQRRRQVFLTDNPHNRRAGVHTWTRWLRAG